MPAFCRPAVLPPEQTALVAGRSISIFAGSKMNMPRWTAGQKRNISPFARNSGGCPLFSGDLTLAP